MKGTRPFGIAVACVAALAPITRAAEADSLPALRVTEHQLQVSLDVPEHRLVATDRLVLDGSLHEPLRFLLHRDLKVSAIRDLTDAAPGRDWGELAFTASLDWDPRRYWHRPPYADLDGFDVVQEITVEPPAGGWHGPTIRPRESGRVTLEIVYAGVVADSLHAPDRAYGRSFETTTGRIVEQGAFLSGSTFWVPWTGEQMFAFQLTVDTPARWRTISQGRLREEVVGTERTVMQWISQGRSDEIYLIAGPYEIERRDHDGISLETWTYEDTPPEVSEPYLDAAAEAIDRYAELIGPYPFSKFALVENYWQTGYGMPSFTFLGDRVIRLPFIIHTSYPHEILHNWWGNCVYVEGGNWCEGLTTYGADYAAKEAQGGTAARDYRRDTLLGYRDFAASGGKDFPLARFRERDSAATQAVGYGKTLFVFHMLRRNLGDRLFQDGLRRLYRSNRFRAASWENVRLAFEGPGSHGTLEAWFDQWVKRPGAVTLGLRDVRAERLPSGESIVHGVVTQEPPFFVANVPIVVEGSDGERQETNVESPGEQTTFRVRVPFRARRVAADPDFHLFRLLYAEEVAPALSGVLGADSTRIVLGSDASDEMDEALRALAESWGQDSTIVVVEERDASSDFAGAVWYFGDGPMARAFRAELPDVPRSGGTLVAAGRRGGRPDRPAAILWPESAEVVPAIGRKTPHYSRYSYLVFDGESNVAKGAWDPGESPLVVTLPAEGEGGGSR